MIRGTRSEKLKCSNQQKFCIMYTGGGSDCIRYCICSNNYQLNENLLSNLIDLYSATSADVQRVEKASPFSRHRFSYCLFLRRPCCRFTSHRKVVLNLIFVTRRDLISFDLTETMFFYITSEMLNIVWTQGSSVCSWRDQIRSIIMSVVISALDSEILWKNVKNSCKSLSEPEVIESLLPTLNLDWNVWDAEKSGITSCHLYKWREFKRQVAE